MNKKLRQYIKRIAFTFGFVFKEDFPVKNLSECFVCKHFGKECNRSECCYTEFVSYLKKEAKK